MKTRSATVSILSMRCPRCREGKMFPEHTLYSGRFMKMNQSCSCCGQSFMPEPAYYFGAMFISYALNAAYFIAIWVALYAALEEIPLTLLLTAVVATIIGLLPITFRLSRVLWIYIFVSYEDTTPYRNNIV